MTEFTPQAIPDVILIKPKRFEDARGFFIETFHSERFEKAGVRGPFVQDNHSLSRAKGVIRGLHFQTMPTPQGKLVRCTRGAILDVAVDIRTGSPTFGKHVAVELTAENGWQVYVPVGFAHGFSTLVPDTEVQYKVTGPYAPECDAGMAHDDPALGIDWRVAPGDAILSDKDKKLGRFAALPAYFRYGEV